MTSLFVQYLAIYNNENLPHQNIKFAIVSSKFGKYEINPQKISKWFQNFTKVAQFGKSVADKLATDSTTIYSTQ